MEITDLNPDRSIVDVDKLSIKGTSVYQTSGGLWVLGCIAISGAQFGVCPCGGGVKLNGWCRSSYRPPINLQMQKSQKS